MTVYGFTAGRSIDHVAIRKIVMDLATLEPEPTHVVTGGAPGGDAVIAKLVAILYPKAHQVFHLPKELGRSDWPNIKAFMEAERISFEAHFHDDYRKRNQAIVDETAQQSGELIGYPIYPEQDGRSKRSGTWMTLRMARRQPMKVRWLVLEGEHHG